jgi:RNA polymerase sigma-70 factor (ECF subfamily)
MAPKRSFRLRPAAGAIFFRKNIFAPAGVRFASCFVLPSKAWKVDRLEGGKFRGMTDTSNINREGAGPGGRNVNGPAPDLHAWFVREVLPLEAALRGYLRNNRQGSADIADLLQDIYVRVYEAACVERPVSTKAFVFATAHNLLVNRVRREKIVPLTTVENLEALGVASDAPGPDETTIAREELRRVQSALDQISPRSRQAIVLRQVEGLTRREIAQRMDVTERAVKFYLSLGMRALAAILFGDAPPPRGKP